MSNQIEKAKKEFNKYLEKYDIKNEQIQKKIAHSYRVAEISRKIAQGLELPQKSQDIAELIGLLHDIGRFEKYSKFKNYKVISEFDHGDFGAELLKEEIRKYNNEKKYDDIIIKSVKFHNKYEVKGNFTEKEMLFIKLIRDADKIDILYECANIFWKGKENIVNASKLSQEIYDDFLKNKIILIKKDRNYDTIDDMLITLAYTFDINYKPSYQIIKEQNYINKTISRFKFQDIETQKKVNELIKSLNIFIQNKIDKG